jgi:hypothetical protein
VISFFAVRCGRPALSTHLDMKGPRSVSSENPSPELYKITDCPGSFAGSPGVRCRLSDSRLFEGQARNSKFKASILQVSSIRRLDVSRRVQGRGKCIPIPRGLESRDSGMGN